MKGFHATIVTGLFLLLTSAFVSAATRDAPEAQEEATASFRLSPTLARHRTGQKLELVQNYPPPANACCTPYAPCPLSMPLPMGSFCQCFSTYGAVGGRACRL